jgi:hypothetical protein
MASYFSYKEHFLHPGETQASVINPDHRKVGKSPISVFILSYGDVNVSFAIFYA